MEGKTNKILVKETQKGEIESVLVIGMKRLDTDGDLPVDDKNRTLDTGKPVQSKNSPEGSEDKQEKWATPVRVNSKDNGIQSNGTLKSMTDCEDPEHLKTEKQNAFSKFISIKLFTMFKEGEISNTFQNTLLYPQTKLIQKNHIKEKVIFMVSVSSLIFLGYSVMYLQWILPYFYTITAPPLLLYRLVTYWQNKWQLFMCDFCYFANILCFVFLWGVPWQTEVFTIFYAFNTGPLPWATILYRNSLVFHSVDKLTSVYIHILPFTLGFSIRWYSPSMSSYWYTDFVDTYNEDVGYMFLWLIGLPYVLFISQVLLYTLCVSAVCKPGEQYVDSIRYLSGSQNGCTSKVLGCMGPTHKTLMYNAMCLLYGFLSIFVLPLFYKYFILHCLLVVVVMLITIWNGASYYIDYFGPREVKL